MFASDKTISTSAPNLRSSRLSHKNEPERNNKDKKEPEVINNLRNNVIHYVVSLGSI